MTPQELKNSILQRAIQGKLVEQRSEEGTAEELYRQIQAEKQALIKAGKIKKEKPLPEIAEEEKPFDIPESWMWVRVGNLIHEIQTGKSIKCEEVPPKDGQCGILKVSAVTWGKYQEEESKTCFSNDQWIEEYAVCVNDFLICRANTKALVGGCVVVDAVFKRLMLSDKILRLCFDSAVYKPYLLWSMRSPLSRTQLSAAATGTSDSMKNISQDAIRSVMVPLPPLAEQKRIVAKIEELLPLIDRYEAAYTRLEEFNKRFPGDMQKSLLQMAIQGKLVEQRPEEGTGEELFRQIQAEKQALIKAGKIKKDKSLPEITDDEKPFDIPESWKWGRFSEIMNSMSTGPFGSMLHKTDYITNGIPLVNPANIVNGKIIPSDKMMISEETRERLDSYVLHTGMIVLGRRGEMGRCAVVTENENGWLCGTGSFFMEPNTNLYVFYIATLFSTPYVKHYLGGESVGTTMSNLNHTILSKMPIPLPPYDEQKRIVAKLEELLPLCERLK